MMIQEFQSSRSHFQEINHTLNGSKHPSSPYLAPNPDKAKLSNLIDECGAHEDDIKQGINTYYENLKYQKLTEEHYDLVRDTLKEVDIANHKRLARLYQY